MVNPGHSRHFLIAFVIAAVGYLVLYQVDRQVRLRKGPWEVVFARETNGVPSVTINQPTLKVTGFKLVFPNEKTDATNLPVTVRFDQPLRAVPFGELAFDDVTFLPGTVVLNVFGHGVQLLPRTLTLDQREIAWRPGAVVEVTGTNRFPYPIRKN
jgi:hypothetical protein